MKKALMIASILFVAVVSTACINNLAVQELNNKAAEYMQKGDYESAMNRLQASLDLDNTMYETYYNLGIAAINAKKYEKAIEAFDGGIRIKPDYADFYYSMGLAQTSLADEILEGKNSKVEEDVNKVDLKEEEIKISEEDKLRARELKELSIANLKKYLEMVPDAKDKQTVESLIVESNNFLNPEVDEAKVTE